MDDVQQMIINEVNRLERAVDNRAKALAQLEEKVQQRSHPYRYVLEYDIPTANSSLLVNRSFVTRSFVVNKDCKRFVCQDLVCSVAAVGVITGVTNSNKMTLSPEWGDRAFNISPSIDFVWRIRDTSTDREWQSNPLPRFFLASGLTSGLPLPWSSPLRPGAEIEVSIMPTILFGATQFFSSITSYTIQIAFVGYEVL